MKVSCPSCGGAVSIPPERAANPRLKVKCRCTAVFAVAEAKAFVEPVAQLGMAPPALVAKPAVPAAPARPATPPVPAAGARPAPAARPATPASRPATPAPPAAGTPRPPRPAAADPRGRPLPSRPVRTQPSAAWAKCTNHPEVATTHVCPQCAVGYCGDCAPVVQSATICPKCDSLCVPAARFGEKAAVGEDRSRPLLSDLGLIFSYPFRDPIAYVMLAIFTGIFGMLTMGGFLAVILSQGVLFWYAFNAVSKVAIGNTKDVMPDFRDIYDVITPLRLGVAALVVSYLPIFLCVFFIAGLPALDFVDAGTPGEGVAWAAPEAEDGEDVVPEEEDEEGGVSGAAGTAGLPPGDEDGAPYEEPRAGVLGFALLGLAIVWKLTYTPVALTVAALSGSVLNTINPVIGFSTIRSMGAVYWQAAGLYTAIAVVQGVLGMAFDMIPVPIVPSVLKAFVDAYCWLAIGCTLGLAVYKKAPELGWD
jgi:hypothetical protein